MTPDTRFDNRLSGLLEDLYLGRVPDYEHEVLVTAVRHRQRAAWTFPGRWLPMVDLADRPAFAAPLTWRIVGLAVLLIALLGAILAVAGSRRAQPPAPFGPARNGVIAWALDGDIYIADPTGGAARLVVGTPDIDRNPVFSRDGTQLAFMRQVPHRTGTFDLVVTTADGTGATVLSATPFPTPESVQWAPDGRSVLVNDGDMRLTRYFLDGAPPQGLAKGVHLQPDAFRPPDGGQILYVRDIDPDTLRALDADGSGSKVVFGRGTGCACKLGGPARWSPDGTRIAVPLVYGTEDARIHVMAADGSGLHPIAPQAGTWVQNDPAWSPDGTRIAFNRWQRDDAGEWQVRAIAIATADGASLTEVGVAPAPEGALLEWSPDGTQILSLPGTVLEGYTWSPGAPGTIARPTLHSLDDAASRQLDLSVGSNASWQRLAP